ncbi:MAG: hypothetical protein OHK93_002959 [Ramalina farinacea]|uniref:AB hydrolase-1 domain-containing protein n=1 Tax=Ramalina farinacea TaxID=258253 RepID=A0AA43QUE1_9LECA|nr:hypothetical protein [Ramalina farinacea]
MDHTSFVEVSEGSLFWKVTGPIQPTYGKGCAQPMPKEGAAPKTKTRPTLLFIHAAITDHTLWKDQAHYFNTKGWSCVVYDLFGYGQSFANEQYLASKPKPKIKHYEHTLAITRAHFDLMGKDYFGDIRNHKYIIVGLSYGASIALDFTLAYPHLVHGLVICAGGIGGYEPENSHDEDDMFATLKECIKKGDVENAVRMLVRIWGDGTKANQYRLSARLRSRLADWCRAIITSEVEGTGGCRLPSEEWSVPGLPGRWYAAQYLHTVKIPIRIANGKYDETATRQSMLYLAEQRQKTGSYKEFRTGHLINLELPDDFNRWTDEFLQQFIKKD